MPLPAEWCLPIGILLPFLHGLPYGLETVSILIPSFLAGLPLQLKGLAARSLQSAFGRTCHHSLFLMRLPVVPYKLSQALDIMVELILPNISLMIVVADVIQIILIVISANSAILVLAFGFGDELNRGRLTILEWSICFSL